MNLKYLKIIMMITSLMVSIETLANEYDTYTCPELEVELVNSQTQIEVITQEINESETLLRHSNPYGQLNSSTAAVNQGWASGKIKGLQYKRNKLLKQVAEVRKAALSVCASQSKPIPETIDSRIVEWATKSSYFDKDELKTSVAIAEMDNLRAKYPNTEPATLLPLLDAKMKEIFPDIK